MQPQYEEALRQVLSQTACKQCHQSFSDGMIEVLHQGRNFAMVRIGCKGCDKIAGVAIIRFTAPPVPVVLPVDGTVEDERRLRSLDPIKDTEIARFGLMLGEPGWMKHVHWTQHYPLLPED